MNSLQSQIEQTKEATEQAGLLLHTKKTKTVVFGERNVDNDIRVAGNTIENVEKFEYIGSLLTWDNNYSDEIKRRIGKATGAMVSLKYIWNSKKLRIDNKMKILKTCVFSVLLYASKTWTLKETAKTKLLAFKMKCYRQILRINWRDMIRNEDIRKRISKEKTIIDWSNTYYFLKWKGNPEEDVHAESGWTTWQNGVNAVDKTCSTLHKTDGHGWIWSCEWLAPTGTKPMWHDDDESWNWVWIEVAMTWTFLQLEMGGGPVIIIVISGDEHWSHCTYNERKDYPRAIKWPWLDRCSLFDLS